MSDGNLELRRGSDDSSSSSSKRLKAPYPASKQKPGQRRRQISELLKGDSGEIYGDDDIYLAYEPSEAGSPSRGHSADPRQVRQSQEAAHDSFMRKIHVPLYAAGETTSFINEDGEEVKVDAARATVQPLTPRTQRRQDQRKRDEMCAKALEKHKRTRQGEKEILAKADKRKKRNGLRREAEKFHRAESQEDIRLQSSRTSLGQLEEGNEEEGNEDSDESANPLFRRLSMPDEDEKQVRKRQIWRRLMLCAVSTLMFFAFALVVMGSSRGSIGGTEADIHFSKETAACGRDGPKPAFCTEQKGHIDGGPKEGGE